MLTLLCLMAIHGHTKTQVLEIYAHDGQAIAREWRLPYGSTAFKRKACQDLIQWGAK